MTRLPAILMAAAGFTLWYRYSLPTIRHDVVKFRAWRQRVQEWKNAGTIPARYRRDDLLWSVRLAALAVCTLAFAIITIVLFALDRPPLGVWGVALLTILCFVAAGIWGAMSDSVR